MFDIDGTLTETTKVDADCFVRSFKDVFGLTDIDTDWSNYRHTTDAAIFHEIFTARTDRSPSTREVSQFRERFIQLLADASSASPFLAIAGAHEILSRLTQSKSHGVSLATGAWSDSARLKMTSAGMCFDDYPAASADDAPERETIMQLSRQRAIERHWESFACTVYVGDGIWDARACRNAGIPFIGIGTGSRAERLLAEGAVRVFPDFREVEIFLKSLDEITNRTGAVISVKPGVS